MSNKENRFVAIGEDESREFVQRCRNNNTKRATDSHIGLLKNWLQSRNDATVKQQ